MSREEILKKLNSLHHKILNTSFAEKVSEAEMLALVDAKEILKEQPKADWIPCTVVDHPEHCNDCEVTIKDTIGYFRDIAYYTDKWRRLADETPVNVIAWKEPSRPYKKEGAE